MAKQLPFFHSVEVPLPLIQLRGDSPKSTQLDLLSLGYVTAGGIGGEFHDNDVVLGMDVNVLPQKTECRERAVVLATPILLIIDTTATPPVITSVVRQLGDGLESVAVHPTGDMAVVSCLDGGRIAQTSHLAAIDLRSVPPRLLYHIPVPPVPEGTEFSPNGHKLFVGCTGAHHIAVFDVIERMKLKRTPYVIRTGHFHASLAISKRHIAPPD